MASLFGLELPDVSLKIFILVHFSILPLTGLGALPDIYHISNFFILLIGLWTIADKANSTASLFFPVMMAISCIQDIFLMILYHGRIEGGNMKFGIFMAVLYLLVKPVTCFYAHNVHKNTNGSDAVGGYSNFDDGQIAPTYLPPPSSNDIMWSEIIKLDIVVLMIFELFRYQEH